MKSVKQRMLEGLPKWVRDKVSACNTGDAGHGDKIPGGGHGNPLQYSCLENPYGQRSLAGYSLWGQKESGMTE